MSNYLDDEDDEEQAPSYMSADSGTQDAQSAAAYSQTPQVDPGTAPAIPATPNGVPVDPNVQAAQATAGGPQSPGLWRTLGSLGAGFGAAYANARNPKKPQVNVGNIMQNVRGLPR